MHIQWNHPLGGATVTASLNSAMSLGVVKVKSTFASFIGLSDTTILSACLISAASFTGSTGCSSFLSAAWQAVISANNVRAKTVRGNIKRGKSPNDWIINKTVCLSASFWAADLWDVNGFSGRCGSISARRCVTGNKNAGHDAPGG